MAKRRTQVTTPSSKAAPARSARAKAARSKPSGSRAKPSRTGLLARTTEIDLHIDRALKKRWVGALDRLKSARREGSSAFDELWETVAEIVEHDPPLYLAGGFATTKAFVAEHLKESERTARRLMRVAKFASPHEEARYGVSKLDAALSWLEAKAGKPRGQIPVDFARLRVPLDEGGTISFEEASVLQITAATRKLLRASQRSRTRRPPLVREIVAALGKPLRGITVTLRGDKLSLGNIPTKELPALAKVLARAKPS